MPNEIFQGMSINGISSLQLASFIRRRKFGNGNGRFSDKVIKIPPKRTGCLRLILNDFEANANGQSFLNYDAQGKKYFYEF
jgi:sulfite reductase (ferredoxin)